MKRVALLSIGVLVALYCTAWAGTCVFGRRLLERHMRSELQAEWRRFRTEADARNERFPGDRDRIAFRDGPILQIKAFSCSGPLVVDAELDRTIGGLNGRGTVGRYLVTPWTTYILWEHRTWVS